MVIDDSKRLLALTTVLGADLLSPIAFQAEEQISTPYSVTIDVVSAEQGIKAESLLFTQACLTVQQNGVKRYFNGMVRSFAASGLPQRGMWRYTLSIAPKLWFMSQTVDCRIFQQKTVLDIVQTLCGEAAQTVQMRALGTPAPLEYVTQYNETDLHFIQRLLEQEGFYYVFEQSAGDHIMVVTNQNQSFPASPKPVLSVIHEGNNIDVLSEWRAMRATATGSVRLMDYNPSPNTLPDGTTTASPSVTGDAQRDVMMWPALATVASEVTARTKIAIEAATAEAALIETAGSNHTLGAGSRFTLFRDPFTGASSVDHIIRSASHRGSDDSWCTSTPAVEYANALTVFPATTTWREKQLARRPQMAGIFTAIVLGESGEEIHADSLGRIKVRLKWDHRSDTVAGQAVWVRVIQPWAGTAWGYQYLPRVGFEVAVSFMDGDPDRPVVVGGFYNGTNTIPFAVPAEQTKSGFRTRSTLGGGDSNFSEFSIDDKMGSELVYLHAEKDMTREVENDDSISVKHNQTLEVTNDRTVTVDNDETKEVKNNQKLTVDNQQTNTVKSGRTTTINSGGDKLTVDAGDMSVKVSSGAVSIEAMTSITLKVGQNTITISQSGIEIKGIMVTAEGQAMTQVKAPMVQVNADGMLTLKGGITMIN
jgi:type VI secretion system secreted protein VgrG